MDFAIRLLPLFLTVAATSLALAQRTPDEALRALQEGNRRFAADRSIAQPLGEGVRRTLARGQSPFAIVLCCADSRVPPEHVFNAGLGELFVVRVTGHGADPETVASIEYAVEQLGASLCVVLGHEGCDAVSAAIAQVEQPGHDSGLSPAIQQLLEHIEPAVRKAKARDLGGKSLHDACEEEQAQATVHDCFRRSPLLRRYASVGKFQMVAARCHLQSGEVEWLPNRPLPKQSEQPATAVYGTPSGTPPHVALRMLQAGHRRFLGDGKPTANLTAERREALSHGQQPLAIVLTCADSRVAPEHVFDAGLGELFVVRIAGNTLNDDALASIEYAAGQLGASLLLVMGHSKCSTVQAAAERPEGQELSPNLRALLMRIEPSVAAARIEAKGRDLLEFAVRTNALRAVHEARSRSTTLRALEQAGRFAMLACVYDIASGDLEWVKDAAGPAIAQGTEPAASAAQVEPQHGSALARPAADQTHGQPMEPAAGKAPPHPSADPTPGHAPNTADLPVLDWAPPAAPLEETRPPSAPQQTPAAHDTKHPREPAEHRDDREAHAPTPAGADHGDAEATHAPHAPATTTEHVPGHDGPATSHGTATSPPWRDPIVLVGISGVVSLLAAALLAMRRR